MHHNINNILLFLSQMGLVIFAEFSSMAMKERLCFKQTKGKSTSIARTNLLSLGKMGLDVSTQFLTMATKESWPNTNLREIHNNGKNSFLDILAQLSEEKLCFTQT
jgi:hypothetical protein